MPLPAATTLEAASARPIDQLAGQRRLVAIGQRIDDASERAPLRASSGPARNVGLDIDHDDVLAGGDRRDGRARCRPVGLTGRLDDHLHLGMTRRLRRPRPRVIRVAGDPGGASQPTVPAGVARPVGVEIGDHRDLDPGRRRRLSRGTSSRTAGADERDGTGLPWAARFRARAWRLIGDFLLATTPIPKFPRPGTDQSLSQLADCPIIAENR